MPFRNEGHFFLDLSRKVKYNRNIIFQLIIILLFQVSDAFCVIQKSGEDSTQFNNANTYLQSLNYSFTLLDSGLIFYNGALGDDGYSVDFLEAHKRIYDLPDKYLFVPHNIKVKKQKNKVQTDISFINGSKKQQIFAIDHFQRIANKANLDVGFSSFKSPGFYLRQLNRGREFKVSLAALSIDSLSRISVSYNYRNFINQVNGGLIDIESFLQSEESNSQLFEINLKQSETMIRNHLASAQYDRILFKQDTVDPRRLQMRLGVGSSFSSTARVFSSLGEDLFSFDNIFVDSTNTFDSLRVYESNSYIRFGIKHPRIESDLSIEHQYYSYHINTIDIKDHLFYTNVKTELALNEKLKSGFKIKNLITSQRDRGLLDLNLYTGLVINRYQSVKCGVQLIRRNASVFQENYFSNHFQWGNRFSSSLNSDFALEYFFKNEIKIKGTFSIIKKPIYYDRFSEPIQYDGTVQYAQLKISQQHEFNRFLLSSISLLNYSRNKIVPLPNFIIRTNLGVKYLLFKKKLKMINGIMVNYSTKTKAPFYEPATGVYYNQDSISTGNYPMLNLFVNFTIKKANIFLMLEHLNDRWSERNYFLIPNYPLDGRAFKFGINWRFDD
ncbi:MAG TPA: hypothetical protein PKH65_09090 [Bacteroidia bacterium]|nr:hypothetical protein [Bacteroidia bacterium]HNT80821.1 hypothetical protein [Bacteroidia bacterium]